MVTGNQMMKRLMKEGFKKSDFINVGKDEIELKNKTLFNKAMKIFGSGGGYRTGYGSWVFRPEYKIRRTVNVR